MSDIGESELSALLNEGPRYKKQPAPVSKEVSADGICECGHGSSEHSLYEGEMGKGMCVNQKCDCTSFEQPTLPPVDGNCPSCYHSWDRHSGICHVISDCGGEECGCRKTRPMDGKGVGLPEPNEDTDCERCNRSVNVRDSSEHSGLCDECAQALVPELRAALQQAEQQGETLLEKACWANAQRIIAEANLDQAQKSLAEAKLLDVERVKHSHALSETVNELRLLMDQAQKALAAEAWIEIKDGCEMPKEEEKVCVWNGYHWGEMRYFPRSPYPLGQGSTHYRRITPPAGAVPKEKL